MTKLVPALALIAAGCAFAAEGTPAPAPAPVHEDAVTIGGFVDATYGGTWNRQSRDSNRSQDDALLTTFKANAELQVGWTITEKASAQLDVEFFNSGSTGNVDLEQAKVSWEAFDKTTLTMGKMTNLIGWQAADAPGLWRINVAPTVNYYGNDWTGLDVTYALDDKLTLDFAVYNGWSDPYDADHNAGEVGKGDQDMGYAINATYAMGDMTVDGEVAYAPNAAANVMTETRNSSLTQFGVNVTGKNGDIDFGGEVIWRHYGPAKQNGGEGTNPSNINGLKQNDVAWLAAVRYNGAKIGSITGMFAQVYTAVGRRSADARNVYTPGSATGTSTGASTIQNELSACLGTTPVGKGNFMVNYELAYGWMSTGKDILEPMNDTITGTVEFLAVIE